ncbi:LETM1 and EF-hand domain-containing protein 1, mitochondrial [Trichinella pseudospiralis]|uniref:LETM1 and EF-hand domain-containing protein 1, mitochondrial n=1 Tax=Trichinella pseudospiralis TaxID=6337 RepID=A0A0V0YFN4_TRIPS|nr:LETM1 and EF-hand domain-containing protein 1, mitochondrial [Trichinella pseudospiralis]
MSTRFLIQKPLPRKFYLHNNCKTLYNASFSAFLTDDRSNRAFNFSSLSRNCFFGLNICYASSVLCWNGKRNFHLSAICLDPTGDGHSKVETMLKALKEDVEESERLREKRNLMKKSMEIQKKQSLWLRFKNEMQHYYHGFKLLYIDVKVCLRLLRRLLIGETLMRKERRQLIRTTSDLFRLVPFLIFIIVPFMEFALPLVLKFFPGLLPSTFQEEHKEQEKRNKALKVKLEMAKFLQATLEDLSLERKKSSDGLNQLTEFSAFMKKIREEGGGYVSNDDLLKYLKLFEDELTLDSLSYAQLRALCLIVGIQPIGTTNMLLLQLRLKLRELKADDQLIVKEGIDSLSESELQMACRARGMRALGVPVSRLKAQLAKWLELSLNEQVPPSLLLLSSTLYIQEDVPFSVRLKTILSTLPSHIADEAKMKLAEMEGVRVDNKTKFDLIVSLEEALKKEVEEQRRSKKKEKEAAQKATVLSPAEEVEAVVQAASVPVTESDVLLDSAPLVKDKSTPIDTPIESSELREIEHLVETVKGPLNEVKDDLIELKEQVQEHKEDVEEVQSIFKSRGDDVKVSKAARRLQNQVDRLVERVDKLVERMQEKKKAIAAVDEKQTDPSAIAKHEKKVATLSEVLAPLKQLKELPNEAKMKRIYQVLEAFDEDRDGAIDLDLALKVIDLMLKESVEINSEQVNKALEILKKEEDLLEAEAAVNGFTLALISNVFNRDNESDRNDLIRIISKDVKLLTTACAEPLPKKAPILLSNLAIRMSKMSWKSALTASAFGTSIENFCNMMVEISKKHGFGSLVNIGAARSAERISVNDSTFNQLGGRIRQRFCSQRSNANQRGALVTTPGLNGPTVTVIKFKTGALKFGNISIICFSARNSASSISINQL